MDEDIDIEEHDVLDNPLIKNMILDISNIKTEIEDYEEEDTSIDIEEDYHETYRTVPIEFESDNNLKFFKNKIIVGSKPCTSTQIQEAESLSTDFEEHNPDSNNYQVSNQETNDPDSDILQSLIEEQRFPNKIILGTKTPDTLDESAYSDNECDLPDVSVVLQDCKNFLENNPCFCKECEILFPTDNDLHAHRTTAHSFLVAVNKNKAVKSTTKHAFDVDRKKLLCTHCNVVFPSTIDLLKHTYELLPNNAFDDIDDTHKTHYDSPNFKATTNLTCMFYMCTICTCHFKLATKLQTHLILFHHINDIGDVKPELTDFRCRICNSKLGTSKTYNLHIQVHHLDLYRKCFDEQSSRFKCPMCDKCFSSDYSVRIHLAAKHGVVGTVNNLKKMAKDKSAVKKITKTIAEKNVAALFPKSTLFKCNKCHLHFLSCETAATHSKSCLFKRGDYRCKQCRRYFNLFDKVNHVYQHRLTERFKVFDIARNILNRILCKCTKCNTCFDEVTLKGHSAGACSAETPAIYCASCNHWINAKAMPLHKKIHASGINANDFILTEYIQNKTIASNDSVEDLNVNNDEFNEVKVKHELKETKRPVKPPTKLVSIKSSLKRFRRSDEMAYLYCPTCKCFMKTNKITDKHCVGKCNTNIPSIICKYCGLKFTHKGLKTHNRIHKKYPKLKLKDLKFTNMQTYKRINPPFPKFEQCEVCKVTFFSEVALNGHICNAEKPKVCAFCNHKFSDLAYNLHVQFHEYPNQTKKNASDKISKVSENIPELMKKYKSLKQIWNILFLCQTCDIIIDAYDRVVEHCQDHFCNMESYNVTIQHCDICNLNFVDESFQKHKELHLRDDFNKDSFKIIEYSYDNLLTNNWLHIFESLTQEQINLILSKSMYKYSRCLRMKVIRNGPPSMVLYQCGKCNLIVAPNRLTEHSYNINGQCTSNRRFNCSKCTLKFSYKLHKTVHEKLHEVKKVTAASFRIIEFHADEKFSPTEVTQNEDLDLNTEEDIQEKDPDGLKFIRCQHCGKLINKHKYKKHTIYHNYYDKAKNKELNKSKGITKHSFNLPKQKVHTFYKCKRCEICVSKNNIKSHNCDKDYSKEKCSKCSLWFRSKTIACHYKLHEMYKFNRSNVNVVFFNKNSYERLFVDSHKFKNKELIFYQCVKCTICLWNKVNIRRHSCTADGLKESCKICGVTYIISHRLAHVKMHRAKNFNRSNVKLIQFNDNELCNATAKPVAHKRTAVAARDETVVKKSRIDKSNENNEEEEVLDEDVTTTTNSDLTLEYIEGMNLRTIEQSLKESRCPAHDRFFKCKTCKLLFLTMIGLIDHENKCDNTKEATECDDCGLVFHASEIESHKKIQQCRIIAKQKNFNVYTIKQLGKSYDLARNWIFLCLQCQVYNISIAGMYHHLRADHQIKYAMKACSSCNITFTSRSYLKHCKSHHLQQSATISDLSIAAVETITLENMLKDINEDVTDKSNNKTAINIETGSSTANSKETKIKLSDSETLINFNCSIYNCDVCDINFIHPKSLKRHKLVNKHNEIKHNCPECNLAFTKISLRKHLLFHTKTKKKRKFVDVNDSIVESIPKFFDDSSLVERKKDAIDNKSINETFDLNTLETNHPNTSNQINTTANNKAMKVDNVDEIGNISGTSNRDVSTNDVGVGELLNANNIGNTKNKIFKCSICDVYFLTADDCYEHTFSHTELDSTEYIACKVCELQFCCEFLGRHMKTHREKTFSMDDLIVVEYNPSSSGLTINTYLAVDRLKTKLVSTTTHFDNDDDKSVCVDSTTNENVT